VLHALLPGERIEQAKTASEVHADTVCKQLPWVGCNHRPDAHAHAVFALP
jgi:hypothetical protein